MQTISLETVTSGGGTAYHPPREFGLTLIKSSPTRVAVSGGACFLPANPAGTEFRLAAIGGMSKEIGGTWEAGSNKGGRAAGEALSPNTRYYVYLIQHLTTLQVDVIIHQGGCPHPAGWSEGQILGQLYTDAGSQIDYVVSFGASVGRDKMGLMWGLVDEYGVYLPTQRPSSPQMLVLHPDGRILPLDLPAAEMIATASQAVPADASTVLASSLDYESTLRQVAEIAASIREFGYGEEDIEALAEGAMKQQRLLVIAPKDAGLQDLTLILRASM